MNQWEVVGKAIKVAVNAHGEQSDKSGMPYILHPLRVMFTLSDPCQMAIGALHDVVEDTNVSLEDLKAVGFPERVLAGVEAMTYMKGKETRDEYYARIRDNRDAVTVKTKDIQDNISTDRMGLLTETDRIRLITKYGHALQAIYGASERNGK